MKACILFACGLAATAYAGGSYGGNGGGGSSVDKQNGQCSDSDPLCQFWAWLGECEDNAVWMEPNCCKSCEHPEAGEGKDHREELKKRMEEEKDQGKKQGMARQGGEMAMPRQGQVMTMPKDRTTDVRTIPKPGQCPPPAPCSGGGIPDDCDADFMCPGEQKCCDNGCYQQCTAPFDDFEPNRTQTAHCADPMCPPPSPCADAVGVLHDCDRDIQCPGSEICCNNGCFRQCVDPDFVPPVLVPDLVKDGECPPAGICSGFGGSDDCSRDGDCFGPQKCCDNGCFKQCVRPSQGFTPNSKCPPPGMCSDALDIAHDCDNDIDCRGMEICCNNGCYRQCIDVEPDTTRCKRDANRHCCHWARTGECDSNPLYMRVNCQESCGTCGCTQDRAMTCRVRVNC